ncbi:MAG: protease modulator HflC [Alphaproteobacteria bacterium]|nr:protease modulator HflC [Alphaproteobacteria bacterium]
MTNKIGIIQVFAIIAGAVLILLFSSAYIVYQPEQAIVLQFGEPIRVINEPGLKFKVPFVQNVIFYDSRLLNLDPPAQEVVLNDKKRLDVDSFTRYRIINPLQFYQTVRTEDQARSKLAEIVNSSLRKVLGRVTLTELLSQQRTQIMHDISAIVKKDAEAIGVSVADVRIRRADLPREVMQAINDRMKTERQRDAKEFRAKGQQQARNIRATADKEATIIVAEAEKNAQITRGQGDKEAVELWNKIVGQDVEFYEFYRSLDAYKKSLSNDETSLVLSPDSDFFKYFNKTMRNN